MDQISHRSATMVLLLAVVLAVSPVLLLPGSGSIQAMETPRADRIYPLGEVLLFSLYSVTEPELSRVRADGFTAIGPWYTDKELAPERSRTAGLPYLHSVGPLIDFESGSFSETAEKAAVDALTAEVNAASQQPGLAVWYLANEEPRFWRPEEMRWLESAATTIRTYDPGIRPIMVYEPNHRNSDEISNIATFVDVVAKGSYADLVDMKNNRSWIRWSVEQVVASAASTRTLPVSVLLMYQDQESPADVAMIRSRARHDVYLSLIAGAKGILIYSGANNRPGFSRDFDAFYEAYASAARELNLAPRLADVFLMGVPVELPAIELSSGPENLTFVYRETAHTYPSVSAIARSFRGTRYLLMVNSANQPVTFSVPDLPTGVTIRNVLANADAQPGPGNSLRLAALEFVALSWPESPMFWQ